MSAGAPARDLVLSPGNPAPPGGVVEWLTEGDRVRLRTVRWILPPHEVRGTVVLVQGRSEFIEKYFEVVRELLDRKFSVVTFDWRGQGLSSRQLQDKHKGHVGDFSEFDCDLHVVVERIVHQYAVKPYFGLAHSMGGNVMLRYLHDNPHEFERAVLTAPMLAVKTAPFPLWFARAIATLWTATGNKGAYVFGGAQQDPMVQAFETNVVTSDKTRFERMMQSLTADPDLALGAPTFGWLEAAFRSMDLVKTEEFAAAIETPVLLIGAAYDKLVDLGADIRLIRRLKRGMYVLLKSEHEIMMERDDIRTAFWNCFDAFVAPALGQAERSRSTTAA
ncbi:MAG: alpha/beta fold hydrolase [Alphaproteobacteria bacterium]|nr:alpha/beta fold hydrolase [Alphaproteobacteria bacterium]